MTTLPGKRILLTGGSHGLGPLIAEALAQRGAHIALTARSSEALYEVARSLGRYGVDAFAVAADLSRPGQPEKLFAAVLDEFGAIDILINNAGVENVGPYSEMEPARLRETVEVNLLAPLVLARLVLPHMLQRKSGHIVNIASLGARMGLPYSATYYATKAALAEWARGLRLELEGSGVRCSLILPGFVTGAGLFTGFNLAPPWMVGSCSAAQVVQAVVRAIEKDRSEVIVNSRPARLLFVINQLSPALSDWLMHKLGLVDLQRRKAGL